MKQFPLKISIFYVYNEEESKSSSFFVLWKTPFSVKQKRSAGMSTPRQGAHFFARSEGCIRQRNKGFMREKGEEGTYEKVQ